jgi:pimeloyl-ACP methyl ester carboxylesterase
MFVAKRIGLLVLCAGICGQCAVSQRGASDVHQTSWSEKLVDIGGRRLYVKCSGEARKGIPVVVMDAGMGNASDVWSLVQPKVAESARVCSYDRAGMGKSDRAPQAHTSEDIVNDLHNLLASAGINPPYVLVGHSLGGMNARLYASTYPNEVVGMVLVDSTHEDETDRMLALLPAEIKKKAKPEDMIVRSAEDIDFNRSVAQVRAANWHRDIPLIVLTRGSATFNPNDYAVPSLAPKFEEIRLELQTELVRRSSRGKQIIAEKSGHNIHRDQPELVIDAIRQVVEQAKSTPGRKHLSAIAVESDYRLPPFLTAQIEIELGY